MGLHRSLDTGGEVAGTQAELWEGVSWEGNNDILAHLRLCGCRKGSWYGIPMKMIYWEVPLGNPCRKVGEAVKGGRSTESTVGNWDTWNKIPCCPPRIPAHFSPPLQDAWEILAQVLAAGPQGSSGNQILADGTEHTKAIEINGGDMCLYQCSVMYHALLEVWTRDRFACHLDCQS